MKDHYMTPGEWKSFNYQKKLDKVYENNRHYCKCGHSVPIPPREDRVLCNYCGNWIYRTEEIEKQYKQVEFEKKLKMYLKRSNENLKRTPRRNLAKKNKGGKK